MPVIVRRLIAPLNGSFVVFLVSLSKSSFSRHRILDQLLACCLTQHSLSILIILGAWCGWISTYEEPEHEGSPRRNLERASDPGFRDYMRAVGAPVVPLPESPTPTAGKLRVRLWLCIFYFLVAVIISGTGALVF